ncbi:MAG: hypothetical protein EON92_00065 [Burkholderiales bacterium]|nr:MAG: hypothetical protein EON92_00065 [Burkholderiales bacterium]
MELVLGLFGLPLAEVALIRTIVRLSSSLGATWTVAEAGPCDVLLLGELGDSVCPPPETTVITVTRRGEAGTGNVLNRPIRAEDLIDLLNHEAGQRGRRNGIAGAKIAVEADVAAPISISLHQHARLRRWPPSALLTSRPGYVQLATLLARQPMSVTRLATLAARPLQDCEAFLRELDANALLQWERREVSGSKPRQPHNTSAHTLFSRIRHKLGIVRSTA